MGLPVDKFKPGGSGTPNYRNTARKFFLEIVENLLEILASVKILFSEFV
jgi:hypothetical protein